MSEARTTRAIQVQLSEEIRTTQVAGERGIQPGHLMSGPRCPVGPDPIDGA